MATQVSSNDFTVTISYIGAAATAAGVLVARIATLAQNVLSLPVFRNIAAAFSQTAIGRLTFKISGCGIASGSFLLSLRQMRSNWKLRQEGLSGAENATEKLYFANRHLIEDTFDVGASLCFLATQIANCCKAALPAIASIALNTGCFICFGVSGIISLALSWKKYEMCCDFQTSLEARQAAEDPGDILTSLLENLDHLRRQTSRAAVERLRNVPSGGNEAEIGEALAFAVSESKKKGRMFQIAMLASAIGLVAITASMFMGGISIFPFFLFAMAATIDLSISLSLSLTQIKNNK